MQVYASWVFSPDGTCSLAVSVGTGLCKERKKMGKKEDGCVGGGGGG